MSPSDKVAERYAELFVSAFDRIGSGEVRSLVSVSKYPQQYLDGRVCVGSNAMLTAMVASANGYSVPVWMTLNRCNELGCKVLKGTRAVPIVNYDIFYVKADTRERDPKMTDELYKLLSDEEKKQWVKKAYLRCYPEFNICQTNFAELYPEQWEEILKEFEVAETPVAGPCELLDRMVETNGWVCPIEAAGNASDCVYSQKYDKIVVPDRSKVTDLWPYYNRLLHEMAHSTGSEGRMDRGLDTSDLEAHAYEELVAELSSATVATLLGIEATIQEHNLSFLKSWTQVISCDPTVIYKAVYQSAAVSDYMCKEIGLSLQKGFNVEHLMASVESAQQAKERMQERREQRKAEVRKKYGKGWNPAKVGKKRK